MSYARQMLETYPRDLNVDPGALAAAIDALNDCTQACAADADADLSEPNVADLVKCIRLCLESVLDSVSSESALLSSVLAAPS